MPPKVKVSKEDILNKAIKIVRKEGYGKLNARVLAKELGCSTQPIFSNYSNMEELRCDIIDFANALYESYAEKEHKSGKYPPYKAQGMGYICFAKEEKELFKLLYMRDRRGELQNEKALEAIYLLLQEYVGISREEARLFHLEMWTFVHGIAVMIATSYLELETELISDMLSDNFEGLKYRFGGRR